MMRRFLLVLFFVAAVLYHDISIADAASHDGEQNKTQYFTNFAGSESAAGNAVLAAGSIRFSGTVDQTYDRITVPVSGGQSANIGATDFTVEIWLRPSSTGNNGSGSAWWAGNIFIDRDVLGGAAQSCMSLLSGRPTFMCHPAGGSKGEHTANVDIRDDQWHWLVFTYDADTGQRQIYVDGTRRVQAAGSSGDVSLNGPTGTAKNNLIEFGGEKHFQGTPSFVGNMSEIRYSNVVRYTASSITVPTSELTVDGNTVAYWGFSDGSGSVLSDASAGNNHGSILFGGSPTAPVWSAEAPYSGTSAGVVQFSAATVSISEAQPQVSVSVVRSGGSSGAASVDVSTADGTATAGADYQATMTQLNWASGQQGSRNVIVPILPDTQPEADETFILNLSNAIGAGLGPTQSTTVTILDNDSGGPAGTIQFAQTAYSGQEDQGPVSVALTRTGGSNGPLAANYSTMNGTATAGIDYQATSGTISYADGETGTQSFSVNLIDDTVNEGNETVQLALTGGGVGTPANAVLTIVDNDSATPQPGTIQFGLSSYSVNEGTANVQVTVTRNGGSDGQLTADYVSSDGSATAGSDYRMTSGTVTFADGDSTPKNVTIAIIDDGLDEANETLQITLSGARLGSPSTATITIIDNDSAPPPGGSSGGGSLDLYLMLFLFVAASAKGVRCRPSRVIART